MALAGRHTRAARPMSRRHHGGRSHRQNGHARGSSPAPTQASPRHGQPHGQHPQQPHELPQPPADVAHPAAAGAPPDEADRPVHRDVATAAPAPRTGAAPAAAEQDVPAGPTPATTGPAQAQGSAGCTAPQLRRFIKSRPYVPMHELRRRFGINGAEDEVTVVEIDGSRVFVGLPAREGGLLGELLRGGEVGYELSLDPRSPVVVGLYPMRPVPRT